MPLYFPRPTRRAGYAPVQEEVKLPPQPRIADTNREPVAKFECRIKIHAPKDSLNRLQTGVFSLGKTSNEKWNQSWQKAEEIQPHRHTIFTTKCVEEEEKSLIHERIENMGISQSYRITPKPIDSQHINAEFIPFTPVVESESKLGLASHGFYYYFYEGELVYEMAILGKGRSAWQITRSSSSGMTKELVSKHTHTTILVPVKIEEADPAPQHLFYRRKKLTNDELAEINAAWLDENATKIDVGALVAACSEPLLAREKIKQE